MDTDELSEETHRAVLVTAADFHNDLELQFGVLADECNNDDDYLEQADQLITAWKADLSSSMEEIFFDDMPKVAAFNKVLSTIQGKIQKVKTIPAGERTFT